MYDIRQFKPTLYVLLLLGITGFALAAESPGLWILAAGGLGINAWLVLTGRFTPMPRWIANAVTVASLGWVALEVRAGDATPILTVGNFIVLLHLIKLYEQRANRDYAQLLVLSLLLMVAAAISTASLIFGITFFAYLFLSLYCCLLFHLKVETDQAKRDYGLPEEKINPATLRQDQRHLPRSMRRLTAVVSVVAIAMAITVFLFFPRGAGGGMFNPTQIRPSQALTGFSDDVGFQKIAQISRSDEVVARVELTEHGQRVTTPRELRLRGTIKDVWGGREANGGGWWHWTRAQQESPQNFTIAQDQPPAVLNPAGAPNIVQKITLEPTGTNALFAIAGADQIGAARDMRIRYTDRDDVIESADVLYQPIEYTVVSSGELPPSDSPIDEQGGVWRTGSMIDPQILAYAQKPEVCGIDDAGRPLALHPMAGDHSYDQAIAQNIERHLRSTFTYTLDLTDIGTIGDRDPTVAFLYDFKKGHCEYFASAMTLLCQSLGIPARVVIGFRCDANAFNPIGNYFLVRQSDAHAWCEVYTGQRWETFDPTSGRGADNVQASSFSEKMHNIFDYLEYRWANNVVAYDRGDRQNLLTTMDYQMSRAAVSGGQNFEDWLRFIKAMIPTPTVLNKVIELMIGVACAAIVWYLIDRYRLRKRAKRIGLASLPSAEAFRLLRQLAFYDDLLRILERHRIVRPTNLTPLEFSRTLSYLPNHVYDDIYRLTCLFYRIRYGGTELNSHRLRHLGNAVQRVGRAMDQPAAAV